MAESLEQNEKGLEELELEITCPVCHDRFQDPKMLPCLHYYCKECIRQLALRGRPFPCPECRTSTFLPQNNPDRLPTLFLVNRIKDLHTKMEKALGKVEAMCEMCSRAKAEAFCRQCTFFICDDCVSSHEKLRVFVGHEVVTLEELRDGGVKRIPLQPVSSPTCKEHDEPMKIFCFDCDSLVCRDCLLFGHANHKQEFVKNAASECKQKLEEGLAPLKKTNTDIAEAIKQVETVEGDISNLSTLVAGNISQSFNQLHEILDQQEEELRTKTSKLVTRKSNALKSQKKTFQAAAADILGLTEFVERNLESATDEELLSLHKPILARLEDEGKRHSQVNLTLTENASFNVFIYCAEGLPQLCQNGIKMTCCPIADPSKYIAVGSGLKTAEVNKLTQFTVCVECPHSGLCLESQVVNAELKSLVDSSVIQCEVRERGLGVYDVSYTPKTRGRHSLIVTVNGSEIIGSPFRVCVKIHPTQLDKPVRTITGVKRPWGMNFNTQQQLLVATWDSNKVVILDKQGRKSKSLKYNRYTGPGHGGVAADQENIYATDSNTHVLLKFAKDGKLLKTAGSLGSGRNEFYSPAMMSIIDEKLYICDRGNNRVQIFDTNLEFVRSFSAEASFDWPEDVIKDNKGNLYITDSRCVRVFDRVGHLLHAFSQKGSASDKLTEPVGLCFDSNQFLFVTESGCVSVFKPTGEYVSSFGQLVYPSGIAIDEDGFVYVCDHGYMCNMILVF